jgi:hypothetical protein
MAKTTSIATAAYTAVGENGKEETQHQTLFTSLMLFKSIPLLYNKHTMKSPAEDTIHLQHSDITLDHTLTSLMLLKSIPLLSKKMRFSSTQICKSRYAMISLNQSWNQKMLS